MTPTVFRFDSAHFLPIISYKYLFWWPSIVLLDLSFEICSRSNVIVCVLTYTGSSIIKKNTAKSMDDDAGAKEESGVIVAWSAVWVTAVFAALQSIVFYAFFKIQRNREKIKNSYALYEPRHFQRSHRSPKPFADSWWKDAWKVEQEELLRCVGLDSYMFLRFLRMGARMAGFGTICSLVLIPVYATGKAEGDPTLEFNSLTLARVEQGSNRMWATAFIWWIFVAFVLYEFWMEWTVSVISSCAPITKLLLS